MTGLSSGPIWGWGHRRVESGAIRSQGEHGPRGVAVAGDMVLV